MSRRHRKRSRHEFEHDQPNVTTNQFGLGQTLSVLNQETTNDRKGQRHQQPAESSGGNWQTVNRRKPRHKSKAARSKDVPSKDTSSNDAPSKDAPSDEASSNDAPSKDVPSSPDSKSNYPSIKHSPQARLQKQVKLADLQSLALYLLADSPSPQWLAVRNRKHVRKTVVLMVPGLERGMFDRSLALELDNPPTQSRDSAASGADITPSEDNKNSPNPSSISSAVPNLLSSPDDYYPFALVSDDLPSPLKPFSDVFEHLWPIKTPGDDRISRIHSPIAAMLVAPLPKSQEFKNQRGPKAPREARGWENEPTPVTTFLASVQDLRENGYIVHSALFQNDDDRKLEAEKREREQKTNKHSWVDSDVASLPSPDPPTAKSPENSAAEGWNIFAIDCEMCQTGQDRFELTRVSIVDWDKSIVIDELVKPDNPIVDYLTQYSGMTKEKLDPVSTTLADIQRKLLPLLTPKTILIGHSLDSDLNALKLTHPAIVDTSILYPHPRGPPLKSSLKWLAQKYLQRDIQKGSKGHNSIEDAGAALDLVKLKCKRGPKWGTFDATTESIFKRLSRSPRTSESHEMRTGAVVDWGFPNRGYGSTAEVCIGCDKDEDVVVGVRRAVLGDEDGAKVPGGGVDFIWARMRELEAMRGWWNSSKTADNEALLERTRIDSSAPNGQAHGDDDAATKTAQLGNVVAKTALQIKQIYDSLPPCTAFIVYSGSGDPTELSRLHEIHDTFKKEFLVKKWDQLSVHWTDVEDQALKSAFGRARQGIAFVTVK